MGRAYSGKSTQNGVKVPSIGSTLIVFLFLFVASVTRIEGKLWAGIVWLVRSRVVPEPFSESVTMNYDGM